MAKRITGAGLWGFVAFVAWEIGWSFLGIPREPGPILGLLVGAVVFLDPRGAFWGRARARAGPPAPEPALDTSGSAAAVPRV